MVVLRLLYETRIPSMTCMRALNAWSSWFNWSRALAMSAADWPEFELAARAGNGAIVRLSWSAAAANP